MQRVLFVQIFLGIVVLVAIGSAVATAPLPGALQDGGAPTTATPDELRNKTVTVVTTQARENGTRSQIVAYDGAGDILYRYTNYTTFHDVDPSPAGRWTVMYVAAHLYTGKGPCDTERCARNYLVRTNLSTGERTVLYAAWTTEWHKWHDVDRINATHVLVADIGHDRVVAVNVSGADPAAYGGFRLNDDAVWSWNASSVYQPDSGGPPEDWTHVNDVERLEDGRVMVSLRNHDQVVFLRPGEGIQENWTLGTDDDHSVLYEQHNPDYIPAVCGGPAVIAADSENNRIVEYHRAGSEWELAWEWSAPGLAWPRDADRLPGGHTLVTDTGGDRVLEVNRTGAVVWERYVERPYEAERLGTGDESTGGPAHETSGCPDGNASQALAGGATVRINPVIATLAQVAKAVLPAKILSGILFWAPVWITPGDVTLLLTGILAGVILVISVVWNRSLTG